MARIGDYAATSPFKEWAAITKDDAANIQYGGLDRPPDAIFVGGAGVVALVDQRGAVVNFTCAAGQVLPVQAKRVNSTNTTATLLVALYY